MFTIPLMYPMIFGSEPGSRYKISPNHLLTTLFSCNTPSVCHSRKKESREIFELPVDCFHSEVIHMTSSHMSLTKASHMFTNLKRRPVLPSVQKEENQQYLRTALMFITVTESSPSQSYSWCSHSSLADYSETKHPFT